MAHYDDDNTTNSRKILDHFLHLLDDNFEKLLNPLQNLSPPLQRADLFVNVVSDGSGFVFCRDTSDTRVLLHRNLIRKFWQLTMAMDIGFIVQIFRLSITFIKTRKLPD
jgi:hypothetical protein